MLKMFSAAVIAASILAAPAMAAGPDRAVTTHQTVTTERHVHQRPGAFDANAKMIHRHHHYRSHRHVRPHFHFHKKLGFGHAQKHTVIRTTDVHKHG